MNSKHLPFPLFSIVTCNYRRRFTGIILQYDSRFSSIAYVLKLIDGRGNVIRLKEVSTYNIVWLTLASNYNKDKVINLLNKELNGYKLHKLVKFPLIKEYDLNQKLPKLKHLPYNLLYSIYTKQMTSIDYDHFYRYNNIQFVI